jgi:YD repeat-containing protein
MLIHALRYLLCFGEWRYEWDAAEMLVRVVRPDGCVVKFEYDALGRRVSKRFTTRQLKSRATRWVWDGNNPLHEWVEEEPSPGASAPEFVQAPSTLVGREAAAGGDGLVSSRPSERLGAPCVPNTDRDSAFARRRCEFRRLRASHGRPARTLALGRPRRGTTTASMTGK